MGLLHAFFNVARVYNEPPVIHQDLPVDLVMICDEKSAVIGGEYGWRRRGRRRGPAPIRLDEPLDCRGLTAATPKGRVLPARREPNHGARASKWRNPHTCHIAMVTLTPLRRPHGGPDAVEMRRRWCGQAVPADSPM
jgi:hypothetical protein